MSNQQSLKRRAHFLGTKIRSLRKRNNLTLEDLSIRCVQIDAEAAPSISYLSMIENGKRAEEVTGHPLRANVIRSGPVNHGPKAYAPPAEKSEALPV